jgi:hypothetical protein
MHRAATGTFAQIIHSPTPVARPFAAHAAPVGVRPKRRRRDVEEDAPGKLVWVKASRSYGIGECVELAADGDMIALRDSKNPAVPYLRFTRSEMAAFLDGARRGEFDHLLG